jgi:hypothetical protein
MNRKLSLTFSFAVLASLVLGISSCNLPNPAAGTGAVPSSPAGSAVSRFPLPDLPARFPPPPITSIPKTSLQIGGESFDAYQTPGDRFRLLCRQPCALDERLMDALYAGYKVTVQAVVRTAGFDVLDSISLFDIHTDRDNTCLRSQDELGLTTSYADNPNSVVICLYLTDPDTQANSTVPFTPESAIRNGGLGVFAHEYAHALLIGRFASSHDFVFPIEYVTENPDNTDYPNLCSTTYQDGAPLSYQLCQKYGFTFEQMIQSLLDINRLYDGGHGNLAGGMVGYNQYRAILDSILGRDVMPAFDAAGYQKIFVEEGDAPYTLPYAGESCTYRAALVSDVTVPPGTMLEVDASFEKTWRIRNAGTCNWDGVRLVYVRGEAMTPTTTVPVAATAAGAQADVSVAMTAPAEAGVHVGEWRLQNAAGQDFGPIFDLSLYTRPGCSFTPQISTFTAGPAAIGPGALSLLSWGQVTNADTVEIVGLGGVDPNGNRLLVQPDRTTTYTLQAACGSQTATAQATVTVDTGLPSFAVTDVAATADPAQFSGSCGSGKMIDFTGRFVTNGPGAVLYRWSWSDGSLSDPILYVAGRAGSQAVNNGWKLGSSLKGWMEMKILAPVESDPARADFWLVCTP